ncbi:MAG: DNA polymerase I [Candidatus Sumerlaeaceae bacterium]
MGQKICGTVSLMADKELYLIDGHSQVFKAYHAIQQLSTSTGIPTNAVFGFCQILHALLRNHNPEYLAVVFDRPEATFREAIYEQYKANRPAPPADLPQQMAFIQRILDALRIPYFEAPGYEADDLIATITKRALAEGFKVVIVTADKDLFQLVNDQVEILKLEPDGEVRFNRQAVRDKMGVHPEQMLDFLAMVGDASDNIPGIRKVGPKTAASLLAEFGSLDAVLEHAHQLKGKLREYVEQGKNDALLSRQLVALRDDAPVEIDWAKLRRQEPDYERLAEIYRQLEFRQFLQEILSKAAPKAKAVPVNYRAIFDSKELERFCEEAKRAGRFAIDTETDSLDALSANLVGISLAYRAHEAIYIPLGHRGSLLENQPQQISVSDIYKILGPLLRDSAVLKIGHHIKFDRKVLLKYGFVFQGPGADTLLASYLLNPDKRTHGLKNLVLDWLGEQMTHLQELIGTGKQQMTFDGVDIETATRYAAADADMTLQLWDKLEAKLREAQLIELFERIEMPLIDVLVDMELAGVRIDVDHFHKLSQQLEQRLNHLRTQIVALAGVEFNPSSPRQVADVLFQHLKLQPKRKGRIGYSTDMEVLDELSAEHELPKLILAFRQLEKLKNTYVDVLPTMLNPVTGRIHTSFNQTMAATGRLTSSDPNLQNIPVRTEIGREIRRGFLPSRESNILLSADYSQIELRILAHVSQDEQLIRAFREERDVHALTASKIFGVEPADVTPEQRDQAKVVNFGIIYGMSAPGLSQRLKIPLEQAKRFIAQYFEAYQGVKRWIEQIIQTARQFGYVTTLSGRRRYLADINSQNYNARAAAERMAINAPIQGSSADMIKLAMLDIHRWLKESDYQARMILQVHDELIFDVPEEELENILPEVRRRMENAMPLCVPVRVDCKWGKNWAEC